MSIDWNKAEETPSFKQKVEGRDLLNLRNKINQLETKLTETKDELKKISSELKEKDDEIKSMEKKGGKLLCR